MNELGVGIVYFKGFENFLASHSSLVDVVEMEPQTFWYDRENGCDAFKYDTDVTAFLRALPQPKLFHGVGYPVGGACLAPEAQFNTLKQQAEILRPAWLSEHLSFNNFVDNGREINSGFLLPPLQSAEGVEVAAENIRRYRAQMNLPFAFETGVNYLQPRKNEMPDGLFVKKVAEAADSMILLDLHNILCNQRNGRQSVKDFFDSLPHERIVELHMGGGMYHDDYYLDAHSGTSDRELLDIMQYVVTRLPNLKALIFEMDPDAIKKVPVRAIVDQLTAMHRAWEKRGLCYRQTANNHLKEPETSAEKPVTVNEWEHTLGSLVLGQPAVSMLGVELEHDKGVGIIKNIVFNFRGSVLVSTLRLTTRLLRLSVGEEAFYKHIQNFFAGYFPELLPVVMAEQFAIYLKSNCADVPYLEQMMAYELASLRSAIDKQNRAINFNFDPAPLFASLEKIKLPSAPLIQKEVTLQIVFNQGQQVGFTPVFHN